MSGRLVSVDRDTAYLLRCSYRFDASRRRLGVLKLGTVSLDGTNVYADASKHSALTWEHACKIEAQLKAKVEQFDAPGGGSR